MSEVSTPSVASLQKRIGYHFIDQKLPTRALTNRSASIAMGGKHMERLEFLGDAVLGLVISEILHARFSDSAEGELSRMRSALVRREGLLQVAKAWQLIPYLIVGDSERTKRGIKSPSIAANAVEALIGAVFEDGGWEPARSVVSRAWATMLVDINQVDTRDAKSRLQELTQANGWGLPSYALIDRGVGISPRFEARCSVQEKAVGKGFGERKKQAEIEAAEQAWRELKI